MLTFRDLSEKYLAWVRNHQELRTYEWYANYLNMFCNHSDIGNTPAYDIKPYQVQEWIDSHGDNWGNTYRGGAVIAVKRVYHWAEELGYGEGNPIKKLKKASPDKRKIYMKPEDYSQILSMVKEGDPFRDFLIFAWASGARPQEIRHIESRHLFLDKKRIIFPIKESKGKRKERIIRLNDTALEIITRLLAKHPEGKLFRNKRGEAWTKYAVCNRYHRISQITGKRMFAYAARHGYFTRKLIQGIDPITLAALGGHADGSMLARVYSHVEDDDEHMYKALQD